MNVFQASGGITVFLVRVPAFQVLIEQSTGVFYDHRPVAGSKLTKSAEGFLVPCTTGPASVVAELISLAQQHDFGRRFKMLFNKNLSVNLGHCDADGSDDAFHLISFDDPDPVCGWVRCKIGPFRGWLIWSNDKDSG
mgnify:CR=1 FL=1